MAKKTLANNYITDLRNNREFLDSAYLNNATFNMYMQIFEDVARSMFEWVNLPDSMDARWLEFALYYDGMAAMLKDEKFGFINTRAACASAFNIYGLPTKLQCYSYEYHTQRSVYSGLLPNVKDTQQCILVQNNWNRTPTFAAMELFSYRLYEAQRSIDTNVKSMKFPTLILTNDKQRLSMINMYNEYDGNQPVIVADKNLMDNNELKSLRTDAPFVADKLQEYKKEIFNEALTYLGINNIMVDKKERLITDEANSNNELINLNLEKFLAPRKEACRLFNEKYGLAGTDKEISVRVRSDLHNVIKQAESMINDYEQTEEVDDILEKGIKENG